MTFNFNACMTFVALPSSKTVNPEESIAQMDKTYGTNFAEWVRNERHVTSISTFLSETLDSLKPETKETINVLNYITKSWAPQNIVMVVRSLFPNPDSKLAEVLNGLSCSLTDLLLHMLPTISSSQRSVLLSYITSTWSFRNIMVLINNIDLLRPGLITHNWKLECIRTWASVPQKNCVYIK